MSKAFRCVSESIRVCAQISTTQLDWYDKTTNPLRRRPDFSPLWPAVTPPPPPVWTPSSRWPLTSRPRVADFDFSGIFFNNYFWIEERAAAKYRETTSKQDGRLQRRSFQGASRKQKAQSRWNVCVCVWQCWWPCFVAKMNGLICGGRLEATQTDVFTPLKTLSHIQAASPLNTDKLAKQPQKILFSIANY